MIKKVENTVPLTYVINDLNGEENCYNFLRKKNLKMWSREKSINYMFNGKDTIIRLIAP